MAVTPVGNRFRSRQCYLHVSDNDWLQRYEDSYVELIHLVDLILLLMHYLLDLAMQHHQSWLFSPFSM
ncbi:predicted protein [Arabidopsis lyrata subsp. lyrata]|uniref:Predicted protein n=1 Tax=Arabidopsis lyrata subsp. lyrata TaxID=81972 RepID=D7LHU2_ARALL|nr:predicted protein [Arabidopsis lyrata subsp. lyrata]